MFEGAVIIILALIFTVMIGAVIMDDEEGEE